MHGLVEFLRDGKPAEFKRPLPQRVD